MKTPTPAIEEPPASSCEDAPPLVPSEDNSSELNPNPFLPLPYFNGEEEGSRLSPAADRPEHDSARSSTESEPQMDEVRMQGMIDQPDRTEIKIIGGVALLAGLWLAGYLGLTLSEAPLTHSLSRVDGIYPLAVPAILSLLGLGVGLRLVFKRG